MTAESFVYWLQGCLELSNPKELNEEQIKIIKDHIALVLKKETPVSSSDITITYPQAQPLWTHPVDHTVLRC